MFYFEAKQQFELENMMKYTWDTVEEELKQSIFPPLSTISFPSGNSVITAEDTYPITQIKIICSTTEDRFYEAIIFYDRTNFEVISWVETS